MQMKKTTQNDVDSVAREILIHAAIIAGVCTLIVLVIPWKNAHAKVNPAPFLSQDLSEAEKARSPSTSRSILG